jgi:hypothetical protein
MPFLLTSLDEINDVMGDVDEAITHVDNISNNTAGVFEGIADTVTAIFVTITTGGAIVTAIAGAIVSVIGLLIAFCEYIIPAIALFKMARKAGYKNAWFAFIPVLQTYLEYVLPRREYNIIILKTKKREMVGVVDIVLTVLGSPIIAFLQAIPIVGQTLGLTFVLFRFFIMPFRKVYDLFMTYGDKEKAVLFAIINLFVPGNLVYAFGLLTLMNKDPD